MRLAHISHAYIALHNNRVPTYIQIKFETHTAVREQRGLKIWT